MCLCIYVCVYAFIHLCIYVSSDNFNYLPGIFLHNLCFKVLSKLLFAIPSSKHFGTLAEKVTPLPSPFPKKAMLSAAADPFWWY